MPQSLHPTSHIPHPTSTWYADGLSFTCTQCGNCCSGTPGYVWVTQSQIQAIARFLGRADGRLPDEYLRRVGIRQSLAEDPVTGDCCFLRSKGGKRICGIYPVRPLQCRTWPFWNSLLAAPETWNAASADCPGINRGQRHDFVKIEIHRTAKTSEDLPA